jgi:predicted Ser/Thr protein kinase
MLSSRSTIFSLAKERSAGLRCLRPDFVDVNALRGLCTRRCEPNHCGGECCSDGAGLIDREEFLLRSISELCSEELVTMGLVGRPGVTESTPRRTTLRPMGKCGHTCSWLLLDGRCSLQVLAEAHGQPWWFYKPLACTLFPLRVRSEKRLRRLTADSRSESSTTPPCLRQHGASLPMASLGEECRVINEIWDHDPIAALSSTDPGIVGFDNYGVAAITEKNILWVGELEDYQVVIKVPRDLPATRSISRECDYLEKLSSRRFPQIVANARSLSGYSYPAFEFQRAKIPMYLWLEANPTTHAKVSVIQDLLMACAELEDAGILHQDFCPRNVLVDPNTNEIAVIDFEFAQFTGTETQCLGGEYGFAAPEQYLNRLERCSHLTESFLVGTVLFYAFHPEYLNSKLSFPFSAALPRRMPADC